MNNRILTLFLIVNIHLHAQEDTNYYGINSNLLQYIDVSHPRVNIGVEKYFNNKSVSINLGVFYHNWRYDDTPKNSFSFGGEYKWFKKKGFHYIIGTDIGFLDYMGDEYLTDNNGVNEYRIEKFRGDLYGNVGFRRNIGKRLYIDYFGGIGLRYKQTTHSGRLVPENDEDFDFTIYNVRNQSGTSLTPLLKLGIRLGIKI